MKNIRLWQAVVLAAVVAIVAGGGVWLYQRNQSSAQAEALPNAARIQRIDGEVALNNSLSDDTDRGWVAAAPNQSFSVGDRLYTRENSRASLALSGRNFVRLEPNTSLDAIELNDDRTQLALREGTALFDVGYLPSGDFYEVGTPYGPVEFDEPGLYQVDLNNGNAMVSVLSGLAQVAGLGSSGRVSKGEMLTLLGVTAAEAVLSRLNNNDAGYLVDDYYRYQYPNYYDGRYASYDAYLNDPYYYDPYRRNVSYQYVTSTIPGVNDLDYYGDWVQASNYGYVWRPRVDAAWAPYQQGYWTNDYPYGMTWVSSEPWGYAPYHYGRWANLNNQWIWIPDGVNTAPRYSPALVAFLPFNDNTIGWVPLGPGDPYAMRYYDDNWQPHYLTRAEVDAARLANLAVPNAVTVVPYEYLSRPIDPRVLVRVSPQTIAQVRPTLEPLLVTPLRNAALNSAWGRGKIDLPPGIARKLHETPIVVSDASYAPPFRKNLAKVLRTQTVDDKVKHQKVRDERNSAATQADTRRQQNDALAGASVRGNKDERREVKDQQQQARELGKQQGNDRREQRAIQQKAMPPVRSERIGNPAKQKAQPRPQINVPRAQPQMQRPQPQVQRAQPQVQRAQPQMQRAQPEAPRRNVAPPPQAQKHERQAAPAAPKQGGQQQPPGQSKGGGGGKGKGKKP
jgi:hypothetical protein